MMKTSYERTVILLIPLVLLLCIPAAKLAQTGPIELDGLIRSLGALENGQSQARLIEAVNSRGVNFELTAAAEKRLRDAHAGEELLTAVKRRYIPPRPSPSPTPLPVSTPRPTPRPTPQTTANFAGTWQEDKTGRTNTTRWYLVWDVKQTDTEITISRMTMDPEHPELTKPPEIHTFNLQGEELTTKDDSVPDTRVVTFVRSASWNSDGSVLELLTVTTVFTSPGQRLVRQTKERLQIDGEVLIVTTHDESTLMTPRDTTTVFRRYQSRGTRRP